MTEFKMLAQQRRSHRKFTNEEEELFAEAQKMAQIRYKSYIRKAAENWED